MRRMRFGKAASQQIHKAFNVNYDALTGYSGQAITGKPPRSGIE